MIMMNWLRNTEENIQFIEPNNHHFLVFLLLMIFILK
jgi:hypothetical protein